MSGEIAIMKIGDFVSIDYVGKIKESGEIFDLTIEEAAKRENVFNPRISYRPVNIVIGGNFVISGLDEALLEMKVGEKKTVVVEPEKGFGQRDTKLIRPIPLSSFKQQDIDPTPGSFVTINRVQGKILSADGGRIRVDFNHPLAGKSLEYEVEVKREITDAIEKVKSVAGFITGVDAEKIDVVLNGSEAEIKVKSEREMPGDMKKRIAELVIKWVAGVEKVKFVDEYGK